MVDIKRYMEADNKEIDKKREMIVKAEITIVIGLIAILFTFLNTFPNLTEVCAGGIFGFGKSCSFVVLINNILIIAILFFVSSILYLISNKKLFYFISQGFFWFIVIKFLLNLIPFIRFINQDYENYRSFVG